MIFVLFFSTTSVYASEINSRDEIKSEKAKIKPDRKKSKTSSLSLKFSVLSDIHYYDPSLGTTGKAFKDYLESDRKLLAESSAILDSAVSDIKNSDSDVVLIAGDLTKDGELVNHEAVAKTLKELENAGKKVYVTNGNHDILNPNALRFTGDTTSPVDYVTPKQFKDIYRILGIKKRLLKILSL